MRTLLITFFAVSLLFGSGRYLSPLPLPKTKIINLDTFTCDSYCLADMLQNQEFFSFLAHANEKNIEPYKDKYAELVGLFHLQSILPPKLFSIRLVCKKYTAPIADKLARSLLGYFLQTKQNFTIDIQTLENNSSFAHIAPTLKPNQLTLILATFNDKDEITKIDSNQVLYIPSLNNSYLDTSSKNLYFGGIDYGKQLRALLQHNQKRIAIFYLAHSPLSQFLTTLAAKEAHNVQTYAVDKTYANLKTLFQNNSALNNATILLNTPIIKTSLILSQMRLYNINPPQKLSTQINFSPKLFKLTQPKDRDNLFIATITSSIPKKIDAMSALFDRNLFYEWLDYATLAGIDALLEIYGNKQRVFQESFIDNQLQYETKIFRTQAFSFEDLQTPQESREESLQPSLPVGTQE